MGLYHEVRRVHVLNHKDPSPNCGYKYKIAYTEEKPTGEKCIAAIICYIKHYDIYVCVYACMHTLKQHHDMMCCCNVLMTQT